MLTETQSAVIAHALVSAWMLGLVEGLPDEALPQTADGNSAREILFERYREQREKQLAVISALLRLAL